MALGAGTYIVLAGGRWLELGHWDDIPEAIDELIAFLPEIPPGPHTPEEHDEMARLTDRLHEVLARCPR